MTHNYDSSEHSVASTVFSDVAGQVGAECDASEVGSDDGFTGCSNRCRQVQRAAKTVNGKYVIIYYLTASITDSTTLTVLHSHWFSYLLHWTTRPIL